MEFEDKYCLLNSTTKIAQIKLEKKIDLSSNSTLLRFYFPKSELILGTKIGHYIHLNNIDPKKKLSRPFVPISAIDDEGYVDFMARMHRADKKSGFAGGEFTQFIDKLQPNDTVEISGPETNYLYNGYGSFELPQKDKSLKQVTGLKNVGLIASGSGIASFFQMLEVISRSRSDMTHISLLYVNKSYSDILLLEEILSFQSQNKINVNLHVEDTENFWPGTRGSVTKELLEDTMPPPSDETLIMGSTSPEKKDEYIKLLRDLNYTDDMLYFL